MSKYTQIEIWRLPRGKAAESVVFLAETGFAAFGKGVQLISGTTFPTNIAKRYTCHLMMTSNHSLELSGVVKDVTYP